MIVEEGLKFEKKEAYFVNYKDLEKYIKKQYNKDYDYLYDTQSGRGEVHYVWATDEDFGKWEENEINEWLRGEPQPRNLVLVLMCDLVHKGRIREGDYYIDTFAD